MPEFAVSFRFSFEGSNAEDQEIDFYDVSQALLGFQRSLALTTHLVLNDEVITQAPSLKGARILAEPPNEGSWEIIATVVGGLIGGVIYAGTRPKDTPIGHLIHSAYDFVVSRTLGFNVDYEKSLGQSYRALQMSRAEVPVLDETRFDSIVEKVEVPVREMHRPIIKSGTADKAKISAMKAGRFVALGHPLDIVTYEHVQYTYQYEDPTEIEGKISSYNINTFRGRVFVPDYNRPVPFELSENCRSGDDISTIVDSLSTNARDRSLESGIINIKALVSVSRSGRVKKLFILEVSRQRFAR
ncbi:MAG: hypothetical protein AAGG65_02760 [Pseudomonadota bacterium]